jgi:tetratricopeptide (TPR) repeat protein
MRSGSDTSRGTLAFRAFVAGSAHSLRGDSAAARAAYDSVATLLAIEERVNPNDPGIHSQRGFALASLGRRAEALREVEWLDRADQHNEDPYDTGNGPMRARILIKLGEIDAAFRLVEEALSRPSLFSVHELRLSPDFDPIRKDPRYLSLLKKYANPGT